MKLTVRIIKQPLIILLIITGAALGWAGFLRLTGNFHAVEEGVLYRSSQLNADQLAEHLQASHIKTVLNLRGDNTGRAWYNDEVRVSETAGVQHIDFALSALHEFTDTQIQKLGEIISHAPRPILVHCEGGADRTGLVSALYKLLARQDSAEVAEGQLSFRYGHFPWLGSGSVAMDRTFERVVAQTRNCGRVADAASGHPPLSCPVRESWRPNGT